MPSEHINPLPAAVDTLTRFLDTHDRIVVLTGAGCSTASGIPDYRDAQGKWKRAQPMTYQRFVGNDLARHRYWARSLLGWQGFVKARPNDAHRALATLETSGVLSGGLVTQNVDGLHQLAGSRRVIDLHGRLDAVVCLACTRTLPRDDFQLELEQANSDWQGLEADMAPDGDADLGDRDWSTFHVPDCPVCGGMLKPDVVFYGENVPRIRVQQAMQWIDEADAMLVVGSSLMVYSGYRFALRAAERQIPIGAINQGEGRADALYRFRLPHPAEQVLSRWADR